MSDTGSGSAPSASTKPRTRRASGPFGQAWTLFTLRGVPVRVDASWLIIVGLVIYLFFGRLQDSLGDLGIGVVIGAAVVGAVLFFASLLTHELGHALTSLDRGIGVRSVTLFLLGGVTESTREADSAKDEFVIVGSGPFISLVLAAGFGLAFAALSGVRVVAELTGYLAWLNLLLAIFNVLPGYPLDGGRLLRSVLWGASGRPHAATRWAARVGQGFAGLLVAGGLYGLLGGPNPASLPLAVRIVLQGGLWQILIGVFLFRGAASAYGSASARQRLTDRTAREVMGSVPETLPIQLSLDEAVERLHQRPSLLWPVGSPVMGGLTMERIDAVPQPAWSTTTAGETAWPVESVAVDANESMDVVVERLQAAASRMLLVTEGGKAVGLITPSLLGEL
jgi:Zn-dependent protease